MYMFPGSATFVYNTIINLQNKPTNKPTKTVVIGIYTINMKVLKNLFLA